MNGIQKKFSKNPVTKPKTNAGIKNRPHLFIYPSALTKIKEIVRTGIEQIKMIGMHIVKNK